jgi:Fe2+ or Zn2+ uptake regulation protein
MSAHAQHAMQVTSLLAYRTHEANLTGRRARVFSVIRKAAGPITAREILDALNLEDAVAYRDMNYVRPRITELKKLGMIRTHGVAKYDSETGTLVDAYVPVTAAELTLL